MARQNGFAIRGFRQIAGISVTHMAEIAEVSPAHYRKLEAETREAHPATLAKIAKAVDQPVAALVRTPPSGTAPRAWSGQCAVCGGQDGAHDTTCPYGLVSAADETVRA
jgi:DNA-binding XRE family transcriptional regulator